MPDPQRISNHYMNPRESHMNAWTSYSDLLDGLPPSAEPVAIALRHPAASRSASWMGRVAAAARHLPSAVASALLCQGAWGAAGDLDPTFGDVGRVVPGVAGPIWALEALDDDAALFGGGDYYCYYGCDIHRLRRAVARHGRPGPWFRRRGPGRGPAVLDLAVQADKKVVGVGHRRSLRQWSAASPSFDCCPTGTLEPPNSRPAAS